MISGGGELWHGGVGGTTVELVPDRSVRIAPGTPMQYRARAETGMEILLAAIPRWRPEYHGVLSGAGPWPPTATPPERLDQRGQLVPASAFGVEVFDPAPDDPKRSYTAPDRSTIMTMGGEAAGGLALCTLDSGRVSSPVRHRSIEELWYVLAGEGQISRRQGKLDPWVEDLIPGMCVDVGTGLTFQFRSTGPVPLRLLILTMPEWPGQDEALAEPEACTWI